MAVNRGKQFEAIIRKGFEALPFVAIDRVHDATSGFMGIKNYCDFIVYRKPNIYYLECKAIHGNTLNFASHITETQWSGLLERSKIEGVGAGLLVWFIDHDQTYYFDIRILHDLADRGYKSVNVTQIAPQGHYKILLKGWKKRVFYEYDMIDFLHRLEAIYHE